MRDNPPLLLQHEAAAPVGGAYEKGELLQQACDSIEFLVQEMGDPRSICAGPGCSRGRCIGSIRLHLPYFGVELTHLSPRNSSGH